MTSSPKRVSWEGGLDANKGCCDACVSPVSIPYLTLPAREDDKYALQAHKYRGRPLLDSVVLFLKSIHASAVFYLHDTYTIPHTF